MSGSEQRNSNQISGAITFPARSDAEAQPVPVQPRQPRDLQGLLRFAMEATKAEDAPGASQLGPMDEERRKFLEEALKSLTVDVAEIIQDAIRVLSDGERIKSIKVGDSLPDDFARAFNNLLELLDDIDAANDFYKMGGFAIFPHCFGSENDEIRALAATVLAECCQNNPYCQQRALDCGLVEVLLHLIASERGEPLVKCLYALSCCCREFAPSSRLLLSRDVKTLTSLLTAPEPAARTKAAFLIRYLCHNHDDAKDKFLSQNIISTITNQIKNGRDTTSEHLLSILQSLIENLDAKTIQCCQQVGLKNVVQQHSQHPDLVGDRFTEEKEYCEEILKILADVKEIDCIDFEVDR